MFFFYMNTTNMFSLSGLRSGLLLQFENQILRCAPLKIVCTLLPLRSVMFPHTANRNGASKHLLND